MNADCAGCQAEEHDRPSGQTAIAVLGVVASWGIEAVIAGLCDYHRIGFDRCKAASRREVDA